MKSGTLAVCFEQIAEIEGRLARPSQT